MPLIDHPTLRNKKIPDEKGGWYWLRLRNQASAPVKVEPANQSGWPQGISINSHWVNAADIDGEWGEQIPPPETQHSQQKKIRVEIYYDPPDRTLGLWIVRLWIGEFFFRELFSEQSAGEQKPKDEAIAMGRKVAEVLGVDLEIDEIR